MIKVSFSAIIPQKIKLVINDLCINIKIERRFDAKYMILTSNWKECDPAQVHLIPKNLNVKCAKSALQSKHFSREKSVMSEITFE